MTYKRKRLPVPPGRRRQVLAAASCCYCGSVAGPFVVDHRIPWAKGGSNDPDNLVCACAPCNQEKHDHLIEDWMARRLARGLPWPPPGPSQAVTDPTNQGRNPVADSKPTHPPEGLFVDADRPLFTGVARKPDAGHLRQPTPPVHQQGQQVVRPGDVLAAALRNGRCPVGRVTAANAWGFRLDVYDWEAAAYTDGTEVVLWHQLADVLVAADRDNPVMSRGRLAALADFQYQWETAAQDEQLRAGSRPGSSVMANR